MNFSNLKEWETPRGNVVELAIDGKIAWKKVKNVPISTLAVGSSVFMNVNGVRTEFIVVHQGLPAKYEYQLWSDEYEEYETYYRAYDASCNGTWLLMKDVYPVEMEFMKEEDRPASYLGPIYSCSTIHKYLTNTFVNLLDPDVLAIVKQVTLPSSLESSGVQTKVFLLSAYELGAYIEYDADGYYVHPVDGSKLDYFTKGESSSANNKRMCYNNGVVVKYPTRTTYEYYDEEDSYYDWRYRYVVNAGWINGTDIENNTLEMPRPAMILPSDTIVDGNFNVIA